jgi:diacylglycerol O-acyltransferase / wax synthase
MPERRPIGPVDGMWLNLDRPNNLMVIDSVMWFDEPIEWERLGPLLQRRLVDRFPVFSQRPVAPSSLFGMSHWEDDPDFELSRHLGRATLPRPGGLEALQGFIENRMARPFDRTHPLWEIILVEGYGSGCALVSRFHHSIADGLALSQVLLTLTNDSATVDLDEIEAQESSATHMGGLTGVARALGDTGIQALRGGLRAVSLLPALASPSLAKDVLELGWRTGKVADKLLLGHNPQTPFSGEPGVDKRAVWSGPRTVSDVKRVSRLTGATVNDVLVAAVSGAVNSYLRDQGAEPVDLTTMVPVNVRPPDQPLPRELGNKFALVYLRLPTGVTPALHRVAETKRRMDSIKVSPEAVMTFGLNTLIGRIEPHLSKSVAEFFSSKAIGVTTNVAGPQQPRYVAGVPIVGVVGWVPGSGRQTLGVCIFSFAGTVRVGFKVDAATLPDPEKLVHAFDEDMDHLLWIAAKAR